MRRPHQFRQRIDDATEVVHHIDLSSTTGASETMAPVVFFMISFVGIAPRRCYFARSHLAAI
jgi:hypothetical protein